MTYLYENHHEKPLTPQLNRIRGEVQAQHLRLAGMHLGS